MIKDVNDKFGYYSISPKVETNFIALGYKLVANYLL